MKDHHLEAVEYRLQVTFDQLVREKWLEPGVMSPSDIKQLAYSILDGIELSDVEAKEAATEAEVNEALRSHEKSLEEASRNGCEEDRK